MLNNYHSIIHQNYSMMKLEGDLETIYSKRLSQGHAASNGTERPWTLIFWLKTLHSFFYKLLLPLGSVYHSAIPPHGRISKSWFILDLDFSFSSLTSNQEVLVIQLLKHFFSKKGGQAVPDLNMLQSCNYQNNWVLGKNRKADWKNNLGT